MNWLKTLLASQGFHSFYHAVLAGVVGYVATNPVSNSHAWISGLVSAMVGAWVGWYNGSPAGTNPAVSPVVVTPVTKVVGFFFAFLLLSSQAFAWDVPTFLPKTSRVSLTSASAFLPGTTTLHVLAMPMANIGINIFTGTPSYGYTLEEALLLANVTALNPNQDQISNIIGASAGFYFDLGPWVSAQGPMIVKGELGLIGPDFGTHIVPGFQFVYNFQTGEKLGILNGTIDLSAVAHLPIIDLLGL